MDHLQHLQHLVALQRAATVERYVVRDRMNPFQYYSNTEFVARYRVTKKRVTELLETIRQRLAVVYNNRGSPIPPHLQLTIGLRYMATGNFQLSMADYSDVSQSSTSTRVSTIAARIAELAPMHIKFPEPMKRPL